MTTDKLLYRFQELTIICDKQTLAAALPDKRPVQGKATFVDRVVCLEDNEDRPTR